jgi:hypothetical protein
VTTATSLITLSPSSHATPTVATSQTTAKPSETSFPAATPTSPGTLSTTATSSTITEPPAATPDITTQDLTADTLIIADANSGCIIGGYANGRRLTHSQAASFCFSPIALAEYNLAGLVGSISSDGIVYAEAGGGYVGSWATGMAANTYDEYGYFWLDIPERTPSADPYSQNPLVHTFLYTISPDRLPLMQDVSDNPEVAAAVQDLLDTHFGKGKIAANIRMAVAADIDGDGQNETVVNADNDSDEWDSIRENARPADSDQSWYCLSLILESDGRVITVGDYYSLAPEDYDWLALFTISNVLDMNGDGKYELVFEWSAWETSYIAVLAYDGTDLQSLLEFYSGS